MSKKVKFQQSVNGGGYDVREISRLINSVYYYKDCAFLMELEHGFRLIVIHRGQLLTDETYRTKRGAHIAYQRLYRKDAFRPEMAAEWSHFYPPGKDWLQHKLMLSMGKS